MSRLTGKRITITGPRKAAELSTMVEKLGGVPFVRPAQGTVAVEQELVQAEIAALLKEGADWVILTTGIGTELLMQAAESMGRKEALVTLLQQARIAARGYKTVRALKALGLTPYVRDDDGTTEGILRALASHDLSGQRVALQLYGDHAPRLVAWLEAQGASYHEILPYRHTPPELDAVDRLLGDIVGRETDAVAFTSTPQVRFFMAYAAEQGKKDDVLEAFKRDVVAVAVGKITAEALREEGIQRVIAPEEERMGSMIVEIARYFENDSVK